jgi:hypothetical protein
LVLVLLELHADYLKAAADAFLENHGSQAIPHLLFLFKIYMVGIVTHPDIFMRPSPC